MFFERHISSDDEDMAANMLSSNATNNYYPDPVKIFACMLNAGVVNWILQ